MEGYLDTITIGTVTVGDVLLIILFNNSLSRGVKLILTLSVSKCLGWDVARSDSVMTESSTGAAMCNPRFGTLGVGTCCTTEL